MMLGRPVKICADPPRGLLLPPRPAPGADAHAHRHRKDGNAARARSADAARRRFAYGSYGVASTFYTGALQTVTYTIPRYRFRGCRAFTNKPPCGPKRGHGTPQPRFALEVQLDKIAVEARQEPGGPAPAATSRSPAR
jgi:CO/xanthine dehydrogenase Mo-binding subunit